MDQKLKQIEQLLTLVDERDLSRLYYNKQISELIAPTMLLAVVEMLELPTDQIEWVDVEVTDTVLVLVINVMFDPSTQLSPFLDNGQINKDAALIQKSVRIGLPLPMVFAEPGEIKAFLYKSLNIPDPNADPTQTEVKVDEPTEVKAEDKPSTIFDSASLTKDQIQQMLMFQHLTLGTKQ